MAKWSFSQSQEAQQLLLNVEKLSQLKNILSDMKKGYQVVSQGYQAVSNIARGNFSLHELFLDGMMLVSPEVKKYRKIADIIIAQKNLVAEYKSALRHFNASGNFTVTELDYFISVYSELLGRSMQGLDQLAMVITANKLRMSDDERLQAIDKVFEVIQDKLIFLRAFNQKTEMLSQQRNKEKTESSALQRWYKLN
ncbi:TerB family tellurite resistance protein [Pedobacter sp. KBW06]|uniref:TerB family tellurite resistance protein n=1 Tax=Pedobacter sp. KBW06 TaxID=2153359 RepID=UPI001F1A0ABF|nr:TerB family tellurite resistance protein [Pedobacter sp. KBW06]